MIKAFGLTDKVKLTNMHLFDPDGHIKKYNSPNEILLEFARKRLEVYEQRKEFQLKDLQRRLPYHEQVVKFVTLQTAETPTPDLRRKSRAECDRLLETSGFLKIEESYEYLMKLPVSSFTAETIAKHEKELAELRAEIARLTTLSPADLWRFDLRSWKEIKSKK